MVDESEDGMEEAGFATVGITDQTRDSVLVALLVEVEQLLVILTELGNFSVGKAVFQNFSEVFWFGPFL